MYNIYYVLMCREVISYTDRRFARRLAACIGTCISDETGPINDKINPTERMYYTQIIYEKIVHKLCKK